MCSSYCKKKREKALEYIWGENGGKYYLKKGSNKSEGGRRYGAGHRQRKCIRTNYNAYVLNNIIKRITSHADIQSNDSKIKSTESTLP